MCGGNGAEVLVPGWLQSEGADMSQERNCVGGLCSQGNVMEIQMMNHTGQINSCACNKRANPYLRSITLYSMTNWSEIQADVPRTASAGVMVLESKMVPLPHHLVLRQKWLAGQSQLGWLGREWGTPCLLVVSGELGTLWLWNRTFQDAQAEAALKVTFSWTKELLRPVQTGGEGSQTLSPQEV